MFILIEVYLYVNSCELTAVMSEPIIDLFEIIDIDE